MSDVERSAGSFSSGRPSRRSAEPRECGCGLWLCRECRPENFDQDHVLNGKGFKAAMDALARATRDAA